MLEPRIEDPTLVCTIHQSWSSGKKTSPSCVRSTNAGAQEQRTHLFVNNPPMLELRREGCNPIKITIL
ncbi:hypothetical protein DPMN_052402 [Dreissena polymorpha]|uniref:Uncharacterized protein n=1 Tax=Dreissena polymorpha TaxID=45954 RepID=A0A9D4HPU8_DREPO|nr:hypothetical protein DPMN_052402 [Dreissena polymorpha]